MSSKVEYINPERMLKSPVFSQAISVQGAGKTIYIGGQDGVDDKGQIVAKGDIGAQTERIMQNLEKVLKSGGASFENLVKMNIYIVHGNKLEDAFKAYQQYIGELKNPPVVTCYFVPALGTPDFLIEVDAIAFVPSE